MCIYINTEYWPEHSFNNLKNQNFEKNDKNAWRYYHFTHVYLTLTLIKSKFWKNEKNSWRYYHFTQVYHKWWSYNVTFLRYWAQQTEFVILDHFLSFYPLNNLKNQYFEKLKKNTWRYYHFTQVHKKSWSYAILFLRYGV